MEGPDRCTGPPLWELRSRLRRFGPCGKGPSRHCLASTQLWTRPGYWVDTMSWPSSTACSMVGSHWIYWLPGGHLRECALLWPFGLWRAWSSAWYCLAGWTPGSKWLAIATYLVQWELFTSLRWVSRWRRWLLGKPLQFHRTSTRRRCSMDFWSTCDLLRTSFAWASWRRSSTLHSNLVRPLQLCAHMFKTKTIALDIASEYLDEKFETNMAGPSWSQCWTTSCYCAASTSQEARWRALARPCGLPDLPCNTWCNTLHYPWPWIRWIMVQTPSSCPTCSNSQGSRHWSFGLWLHRWTGHLSLPRAAPASPCLAKSKIEIRGPHTCWSTTTSPRFSCSTSTRSCARSRGWRSRFDH